MGRSQITIACVVLLGACRPASQADAPTAAEPASSTGPEAAHANASLPAVNRPVMGSIGFQVPDVDAARRVLVDGLGGLDIPTESAESAVVRFPDVVVIIQRGEPKGGRKGSVVDHIDLRVPDLPTALPRVEAAGAEVVTALELEAVEEDKYWFNPDQASNQAFVMVPGGIKLEITEVAGMTLPVLFHHIHFVVPESDALREWYGEVFGATLGHRGSYTTADLPGVNLTFTGTSDTRPGTRERALEHIGFDVPDLMAFCARLERARIEPLAKCGAPTPEGYRAVTFLDPSGATVVVTEKLYQGTIRPHWGAR
jgi:catechol 2,3-dioxygenase-like lactoylglutathione lyase family enzyme